MSKQRTLEAWAKLLHCGEGKDHMVVFGAGYTGRGRWYRRLPFRKLHRLLGRRTNLWLLDEPYTSQRCSACAFSDHVDSKVHMRPGPQHAHGTRSCPNRYCRFHGSVSRDANSARNIFRLAMYMAANGGRRHWLFWYEFARTKLPKLVPAWAGERNDATEGEA